MSRSTRRSARGTPRKDELDALGGDVFADQGWEPNIDMGLDLDKSSDDHSDSDSDDDEEEDDDSAGESSDEEKAPSSTGGKTSRGGKTAPGSSSKSSIPTETTPSGTSLSSASSQPPPLDKDEHYTFVRLSFDLNSIKVRLRKVDTWHPPAVDASEEADGVELALPDLKFTTPPTALFQQLTDANARPLDSLTTDELKDLARLIHTWQKEARQRTSILEPELRKLYATDPDGPQFDNEDYYKVAMQAIHGIDTVDDIEPELLALTSSTSVASSSLTSSGAASSMNLDSTPRTSKRQRNPSQNSEAIDIALSQVQDSTILKKRKKSYSDMDGASSSMNLLDGDDTADGDGEFTGKRKKKKKKKGSVVKKRKKALLDDWEDDAFALEDGKKKVKRDQEITPANMDGYTIWTYLEDFFKYPSKEMVEQYAAPVKRISPDDNSFSIPPLGKNPREAVADEKKARKRKSSSATAVAIKTDSVKKEKDKKSKSKKSKSKSSKTSSKSESTVAVASAVAVAAVPATSVTATKKKAAKPNGLKNFLSTVSDPATKQSIKDLEKVFKGEKELATHSFSQRLMSVFIEENPDAYPKSPHALLDMPGQPSVVRPLTPTVRQVLTKTTRNILNLKAKKATKSKKKSQYSFEDKVKRELLFMQLIQDTDELIDKSESRREDDPVTMEIRRLQVQLRHHLERTNPNKKKLYDVAVIAAERGEQLSELEDAYKVVDRAYKRRNKISESSMLKALDKVTDLELQYGTREEITGFIDNPFTQAGYPRKVLASLDEKKYKTEFPFLTAHSNDVGGVHIGIDSGLLRRSPSNIRTDDLNSSPSSPLIDHSGLSTPGITQLSRSESLMSRYGVNLTPIVHTPATPSFMSPPSPAQ